MTTIRELIEQLQEIENKDQTVIAQYFLADHFDLDEQSPTPAQFDQAARDLGHSALWDDPCDTLNDYLCGQMTRERDN